jgi:hypothetical protein
MPPTDLEMLRTYVRHLLERGACEPPPVFTAPVSAQTPVEAAVELAASETAEVAEAVSGAPCKVLSMNTTNERVLTPSNSRPKLVCGSSKVCSQAGEASAVGEARSCTAAATVVPRATNATSSAQAVMVSAPPNEWPLATELWDELTHQFSAATVDGVRKACVAESPAAACSPAEGYAAQGYAAQGSAAQHSAAAHATTGAQHAAAPCVATRIPPHSRYTPTGTLYAATAVAALGAAQPAATPAARAQHVATTAQPPSATALPAGATALPAGATAQPAGATAQRTGATALPAGATAQPAGDTAVGLQHAAAAAQPAGATVARAQHAAVVAGTAPASGTYDASDLLAAVQGAQGVDGVGDALAKWRESLNQMADAMVKNELSRPPTPPGAPGATSPPSTTAAGFGTTAASVGVARASPTTGVRAPLYRSSHRSTERKIAAQPGSPSRDVFLQSLAERALTPCSHASSLAERTEWPHGADMPYASPNGISRAGVAESECAALSELEREWRRW